MISYNTFEIDQKKVEVLQKYKRPNKAKEAQRFLGSINLYRKFFKISKIAWPIYEYISSKRPWDEKCDVALKQIKSS